MNGMAAQAAVVIPTYNPVPTEPRPQSIVIKFAHATPEGRARCAPMYEKELRFYRELAPEVAPLMPVPAVLAAHGDTGAATPTEFFCLVLEDLSVDFELLHASRGTGETEASSILRQVARVQAKFWEGGAAGELDWLASRREELTGFGYPVLPWFGMVEAHLKGPEPRCVEANESHANRRVHSPIDTPLHPQTHHITVSQSHSSWPSLVYHRSSAATWAAVVAPDDADDAAFPASSADIANCVLGELFGSARGVPLTTAILAQLAARPRTLVHGDLNANNLFRGRPRVAAAAARGADEPPPEEEELAMRTVDWQTVSLAAPAYELVTLLGAWLEPASLFETRLDALYDVYLGALHAASDAASCAAFTKEMLNADLGALAALYYVFFARFGAMVLGGARNTQHPMWPVVKGVVLRLEKCLAATRGIETCRALVAELEEPPAREPPSGEPSGPAS